MHWHEVLKGLLECVRRRACVCVFIGACAFSAYMRASMHAWMLVFSGTYLPKVFPPCYGSFRNSGSPVHCLRTINAPGVFMYVFSALIWIYFISVYANKISVTCAAQFDPGQESVGEYKHWQLGYTAAHALSYLSHNNCAWLGPYPPKHTHTHTHARTHTHTHTHKHTHTPHILKHLIQRQKVFSQR